MTTTVRTAAVQDAEASLAGARQAYADAQKATAAAKAFRDGLHADLRADGSESAISATDLAAAAAAITRAELLEANAQDQVPVFVEAVRAARFAELVIEARSVLASTDAADTARAIAEAREAKEKADRLVQRQARLAIEVGGRLRDAGAPWCRPGDQVPVGWCGRPPPAGPTGFIIDGVALLDYDTS